jgi:hypothetical protein
MAFGVREQKGKPISIKEEGVSIASNVDSINFVGPGVAGAAVGQDVTETVTDATGAKRTVALTWGGVGGIAVVQNNVVDYDVTSELNGWSLVGVLVTVKTAGTTSTMNFMVYNVTDAVNMLSTQATIDSAETSSATAATPLVIDTSHDDVATNDKIQINVTQVQTTPATGLFHAYLTFQAP